MDKRSFIRGFGVGVLFTALILGISFVVRTSDAYVKSQALKLGMVYKDEPGENLVFASPEPEDSDKQEDGKEEDTDKQDGDKKGQKKDAKESAKPKKSASPKATAKPKNTASKATEKPGKSAAPVVSDSPQATKKPLVTPKPNTKPKRTAAPKGKQTLVIVAGEWSSDVSAKLERMGIVKNAKQFDKYLNDNGYSERISAGTYSVSADDTYEQIARKITKK